jgi:sugar phosphate isomerase/epimerase
VFTKPFARAEVSLIADTLAEIAEEVGGAGRPDTDPRVVGGDAVRAGGGVAGGGGGGAGGGGVGGSEVGVDLLVRAGESPVGPDDPAGVVAAVRRFAAAGLSVGQLTTDLIEPSAQARDLFAACAESGVPLVRTGFYRYDGATGYRPLLAEARRRLGGLAELAAACGVHLVVPLHHTTIHPSGALAAALVDGLDGVGLLADPGNQAKEGSEDHRLTLDLIGDRLACVGVKNAAWRRAETGWECEWTPLADGVVHWPEVLAELAGRGFRGPYTLHLFYPCADVPAAIRRDLSHLRTLLTAARG